MMYEAVILAGGKNTRLRGLVPAYMKPLVLVNSAPLIVNTVRAALREEVEHVTIVVSPENAGGIADVLESNGIVTLGAVTLLVQPTAAGPGDALLRVLDRSSASRILLLLGDNIISTHDVNSVLAADVDRYGENEITMGYTRIERRDAAERFTRVSPNGAGAGWSVYEGERGGKWSDGGYRCWVGPMIFDMYGMHKALNRSDTVNDELKIAPALKKFEAPLDISLVECSSLDIGTSDALLQVNSDERQS